MADEVCSNCVWYSPAHAMTHGYCKRMPPVFTHIDEAGRPRFYNPITSPHNFCGEFEEEGEG